MYCWGYNKCGQLGNCSQNDSYFESESNEHLSHRHIVDIKCSAFHSLALTRSGKVYAWGFNESGQIGNEGFENQLILIIVNHFDGQQIKQISCGCLNLMALTENGQVFSWRDNRFGELDVANNENPNTPKLQSKN
jgi:alpha-tubulin suppressor-like RCC1 family protein